VRDAKWPKVTLCAMCNELPEHRTRSIWCDIRGNLPSDTRYVDCHFYYAWLPCRHNLSYIIPHTGKSQGQIEYLLAAEPAGRYISVYWSLAVIPFNQSGKRFPSQIHSHLHSRGKMRDVLGFGRRKEPGSYIFLNIYMIARATCTFLVGCVFLGKTFYRKRLPGSFTTSFVIHSWFTQNTQN
jgi:hypothetical protein